MHDVVTMERRGRVTLARCHGDLDLVVVDELRDALVALVIPDVHTIVVDLSDVAFLDCTGLGAIITLARHCAQHGVRLVIADVPHVGRQLLDALDLGGAFVTAPDAGTAVTLAETWADLTGGQEAERIQFLPRPHLTSPPARDRPGR